MHDLHVADKIIKLARDHANKNGLNGIKRININLGSVIEHNEEINPDNLTFNIKNLTRSEELFKEVEVIIKRTTENDWELVSIEGE